MNYLKRVIASLPVGRQGMLFNDEAIYLTLKRLLHFVRPSYRALPVGRNDTVMVCVLFSLLLTGCATEFNSATGRQETLIYGDDKESALGASVALQVEKEFKFIHDIDVNERVEKILQKVVAVCDRKDVVYTIRVVDDEAMNAFSLPGGYVYINKGLIDKVTTDDQLAGVIAHEVAHVVAKHAIKRLQGAYGASLLQGAAVLSGNAALAGGIGITANSLLFQNSREDEFESDRLGVKYLRLAGYNPTQMKAMLNLLSENQAKEPPRPFSYWRTHPYLPQRMARAQEAIEGKAKFQDYLNITGEDK